MAELAESECGEAEPERVESRGERKVRLEDVVWQGLL